NEVPIIPLSSAISGRFNSFFRSGYVFLVASCRSESARRAQLSHPSYPRWVATHRMSGPVSAFSLSGSTQPCAESSTQTGARSAGTPGGADAEVVETLVIPRLVRVLA